MGIEKERFIKLDDINEKLNNGQKMWRDSTIQYLVELVEDLREELWIEARTNKHNS